MTDDRDPALPQQPVLASDAERDRAGAQLRHHYAVGRLTLPELEERAALAYQARTRADLDALLRDLPQDPPPPPPPSRGRQTVDPQLMTILLICAPPAALVYWLLAHRPPRRPQRPGAGEGGAA